MERNHRIFRHCSTPGLEFDTLRDQCS
uniref:Uncharacterized protein n=1 Tax=Anguilla anguilla TaxID=7936 RepID=A0A0E9PIW5_ANGAN